MGDINQRIERIVYLYNNKANPQQIIQDAFMRSPQMRNTPIQLQNMSKGQAPKDFFLNYARQQGATEQNLQALAKILGN